MSVKRLTVKEFLQQRKGHLVLDVRSPGEYNHAHIPMAISFPLFSDEERKIVGTTYKQQSREKAIKTGLDFFGPKMRKMVEEVENLAADPEQDKAGEAGRRKEIYVHCWRGGMRSAAIAWLLDLYGFKVYTLAGGYKAYRNHVLRTFEKGFNLIILGGFTGSGKTEVLRELDARGELVIDLEQLASHKGSAFGSFKMPPQPTQEMFENLLAEKLWEKSVSSSPESASPKAQAPIWVEDESQRIGNLNIPGAFWETMRKAPIRFLEVPFEERLNHLYEEYGSWETGKLIDSTLRISKRLGGLETKNCIEYLETGNMREAFRILLRYYDKRYQKGLHNREGLPSLITRISCETVTIENTQMLTKYHTV